MKKKAVLGAYQEYIYDETEPKANGAYNKYIEIQVSNRNKVQKETDFYLHMGSGDVDRDEFPIPDILSKTVTDSMRESHFRYSHPIGRPTTRELIAEYENFIAGSSKYSRENIAIVLSATGGFSSVIDILMTHNSFQGNALISQPTYPVYEAVMWEKFAVKKVTGTENNGFLPSIEEIKKNIDDDTKFVIITAPNFPFGKFYSSSDLEQLVQISNQTKAYIIIDEIFYDLPFEEIPNIGSISAPQDFIVRVKAFSKDRAVPGFRIGYVIASQPIIREINRFANHTYGLPPSLFEGFIEKDISLRMLMKGKKNIETINTHDLPHITSKKKKILGNLSNELEIYKKDIENTLQSYKKNRDAILRRIESIEGMEAISPDAGFNMGISIKHKGDAFNLFEEMYSNTGVILAPEEVFDMPPSNKKWYRLTFANNLPKMLTALDRIEAFLKSHR